jgi:PucR C-terminal helix-turn-helix domain/GGDEF-like domain
VDRPDVAELIRSLTGRSMLVELQALERYELPEKIPAIDAEWARTAIRLGGEPRDLAQMVDGYRRGHQVQWEGWFELVEREQLDPAARRDLLERGWRFFFDYAGRMSVFITDEYLRERDRLLRTREQRRVQLVRDLLDDHDVDAGGLDYDVDGHHIGAIVWGQAASDVLRALARELDRRLLLVGVLEDTWWGWLGGQRPLSRAAARALDRFHPPAGARLALGAEAAGVGGFRRTHQQAARSHRAAVRTDATVTRYDDIALAALAALDPAEAREFMDRELRGIDGEDTRARRLRDTLRSYFEHGQNAAATAAALGVHEQTVGARLRAVEERTGRPVASRRAELETALRLRGYLGPPS